MKPKYEHIMVPVDGSESSIQAFKKAVHIAKRNDAVLHLVTVVDKADKPNEAEQIDRNREEFFSALETYAKRENQLIEKHVKFGSAKKLIAEELVKNWNIDLIIMGATGKGNIAKMVIGSITNYVTKHARCDVLIAK